MGKALGEFPSTVKKDREGKVEEEKRKKRGERKGEGHQDCLGKSYH
jgi:hypothetical protein